MCGRTVPVDEQGRCPLGHVVAEPSDRVDTDRVIADPVAADPALGRPGTPTTTPSFAAPPPETPPMHGEVRDATSEVVASFVEPRAAAPHPATSVFDEPPPPVPTGPAEAAPPPSASGSDLPVRVRRPSGDQAPARSLFGEALGEEQEIPSALDLDDQQWSAVTGPSATTYDQEVDEADVAVKPSRGVLRVAAGAAFVLLLLVMAWYLATTL